MGNPVARLKNTCKLQDADATNHFVFSTPNLAADRVVTWPNLTADDTLVFESQAQTLSNKTFSNPTITGWSPSNLLSNPGFEYWSLGPGPFTGNVTSADRWQTALGGTSTMSVSREGTTKETASLYALAAVYTHGSASSVIRQLLDDFAQLRGLSVTLTMRVRTATAGAVRLQLYSGGVLASSGYHSGGGAFETLSVTATVGTGAAELRAQLSLEASCTVYADNAVLVVGGSSPGYVPLHPSTDQDRLRPVAERQAIAPELNLLTNPGFEVWQRGNGPFTATNAFTADRWQISLGTSSTYGVTRESTTVDTGSLYSASVAYTQSGSNVSRLFQRIEDYGQLRGRTVTFSCRVRCSTAAAVRLSVWDNVNAFRYGTYHSGGGAFEMLTVTAPIASTANQPVQASIHLDLTLALNAQVDNATLVVGSLPADYTPLTPDDDLTRCMRYYEVIGGGSTERFALLQCWSTTRANGILAWRVPKAVTPTVVASTPGNFGLQSATATGLTVTALAFGAITPRSCDLDATVGSGLVAGNATLLYAANSLASIAIEANP